MKTQKNCNAHIETEPYFASRIMAHAKNVRRSKKTRGITIATFSAWPTFSPLNSVLNCGLTVTRVSKRIFRFASYFALYSFSILSLFRSPGTSFF